jgi:hypothetical protein
MILKRENSTWKTTFFTLFRGWPYKFQENFTIFIFLTNVSGALVNIFILFIYCQLSQREYYIKLLNIRQQIPLGQMLTSNSAGDTKHQATNWLSFGFGRHWLIVPLLILLLNSKYSLNLKTRDREYKLQSDVGPWDRWGHYSLVLD